MKPESQRIAIATARGWVLVKDNPDFHEYWEHPKDGRIIGVDANPAPFPDYLNDLNAMHEAEEVLTGEHWIAYVRLLGEATQEQKGRCHATAAQRAEAFLRTVGRWEE